ncbi:MAG: hypothetical protein WC997_02410 [Porticoccaceae bacterium]
MEATVSVVYVGKKPFAFDNVAGSKKSWDGNGDVQNVTPAQAAILIKYPDQWALVNTDDEQEVQQPVIITTPEGDSINAEELEKPLEKMNKTELSAYAQSKFNKTFGARVGKADMINMIEEWQQEAGL